MREIGAILLISCYELGHQPLTLASPLALLKQAGYHPTAIDTSVTDLPAEAIAQARFVGISVPMHTAMRLGTLVAERVRALNPQAHICFYGLYATLNAGHLLQGYADSVISGEFEQPLLDLIRRLEQKPPEEAPHPRQTPSRANSGAQYNGAGTPPVSPLQPASLHQAGQSTPEPYLAKIQFAVPDRTSLPGLHRYARFQHNGTQVLAGYTETSRGCLHTCRHCPITPVYRGRFFVIPQNVVLADIRQQVAQGARHITFGDPDFLNGPRHALAILRQMHQEFPDLTFDATIKIEHILEFRHYMPQLKALGCAFIVSAVESLSDQVLAKLKKDHTRADVIEALQILDEAGIPLRPSLVAFTPWTTLDDYLEVLDFIETHRLIAHVDPVQYTIRLLIPPGSAVLELPDAAEWLGPLDAAAYTYRWQHPDPRMDILHGQVSELVEAATRAQEDIVTTFYEVKALAMAAAGRVWQKPDPDERPVLPTVPGLTEAWFC